MSTSVAAVVLGYDSGVPADLIRRCIVYRCRFAGVLFAGMHSNVAVCRTVHIDVGVGQQEGLVCGLVLCIVCARAASMAPPEARTQAVWAKTFRCVLVCTSATESNESICHQERALLWY